MVSMRTKSGLAFEFVTSNGQDFNAIDNILRKL